MPDYLLWHCVWISVNVLFRDGEFLTEIIAKQFWEIPIGTRLMKTKKPTNTIPLKE